MSEPPMTPFEHAQAQADAMLLSEILLAAIEVADAHKHAGAYVEGSVCIVCKLVDAVERARATGYRCQPMGAGPSA
jgi:hypothetical protein